MIGGLNGNLAGMLAALFDPSDLATPVASGSTTWNNIVGDLEKAFGLAIT